MNPEDIAAGLEAHANDPANADRAEQLRTVARALRVKAQQGGTSVPQQTAMQAAPEAAPKEGFFKRALGTIHRGAHDVAEVGKDVWDTRGAALLDPRKRHALERGVSDVVTAGLATKLAEKAGFPTAEQEGEDPRYRTVGNIGGGFLPSPFNHLGREAGAVLGGAVGKVEGKAAGAGIGAAKALLGYEAGATTNAAAQAALNGGHPVEAAREAAKDPAGVMLAGVAGAAGGAAEGGANRLRSPKTQSGRDLETIRKAGGQTRMFGAPAEGGLYEHPMLKGAPEGRAGSHEVAGSAVEAIRQHNEKLLEHAKEKYGVEEQMALQGVLQQQPNFKVHPDNAHRVLDQLEAENTDHMKRPKNAALKAYIDHYRSRLSTTVELPQEQYAAAPPIGKFDVAAETAPTMAGQQKVTRHIIKVLPAKDFLDYKKIVNNETNFDVNSVGERPKQMLAEALAKDAEQVPGVKELNARYAATMNQLKAANDALFGRRQAMVPDRPGLDKAATQRLSRLGDPTQAALAEGKQIEQLRGLDPEYARQLQLVEAKKAMERLRYGQRETSNGFEAGVDQAVANAGGRMAGAAVGGAVAGPIGAVAGQKLGGDIAGNWSKAKVRIGLPVADKVARHVRGERVPLGADVLTRTLAKRREKRKQLEQSDAR